MNGLLKDENRPLPISDNMERTCKQFSVFFSDKISNITRNIELKQGTSPPVQSRVINAVTERLTTLAPTTCHEVKKVILSAPSKSCTLDILPTWLLKKSLPAHLPVLVSIINTSFADAKVLNASKEAIVTPLLKKPSLDISSMKNYRPVSNLLFLGKVIEKLVLRRLNHHMELNNLSEKHQSAYKTQHSTETALLKVHSDIAMYLDRSEAVLLVLLDLSAAFDTISHCKLIDTLRHNLGVDGAALEWFRSYLQGRTQCVSVGSSSSKPKILSQGVPQGSVLGPVLFSAYTSPLQAIIEHHRVQYHKYADDLQLYINFNPKHPDSRKRAWEMMRACIVDIQSWMTYNYLQLNEDKTEVLCVQSPFHLRITGPMPLLVGDITVNPADCVRNLGVMFHQHLSMHDQVTSIIQSCNYHLRNIGCARKYLTREACQTAVQAMVISRLDYCCSLFTNIPEKEIHRLQIVQNRAARIITRARPTDHITPILADLHWLPIYLRIKFRLMVHTYKCIHGTAPSYLAEKLTRYVPARTLRSAHDSTILTKPLTVKGIGKCSFGYASPATWNTLPQRIRELPTLTSFKRHLKAHFYSEYFK